jgi:hypothetical protein
MLRHPPLAAYLASPLPAAVRRPRLDPRTS